MFGQYLLYVQLVGWHFNPDFLFFVLITDLLFLPSFSISHSRIVPSSAHVINSSLILGCQHPALIRAVCPLLRLWSNTYISPFT